MNIFNVRMYVFSIVQIIKLALKIEEAQRSTMENIKRSSRLLQSIVPPELSSVLLSDAVQQILGMPSEDIPRDNSSGLKYSSLIIYLFLISSVYRIIRWFYQSSNMLL